MTLPKPMLLLITCLLPLLAVADQSDPRLDDLFRDLRDTNNAAQAAPLENSIWQIWTEHADAGAYSDMIRGIRQIDSGDLNAALQTYTQLTEQYPDYAEAWNKRATVHYLLQNFAASDADITRTLQLEPFHFGALSGRGLVKIAQGKYLEARNAFNSALEVNPGMDSVRANLRGLDEYLRNGAI